MARMRYLGYMSVLTVLGCSNGGKEDQGQVEIVMGATISRTGPSAVHTWGNAFELAASDASAGLEQAGYPTGKHLAFTPSIADSQNDATITVPRAIELVQEEGAKMILDGTSADSLALNKLAYDDDDTNDIDVPIVCVACSSPSHHNPTVENADPVAQEAFRNTDKWHFGLSMSSAFQSQVLWNIIADKTPEGNAAGDLNGDGTVKIATIAIDDPFGTGFQNAFESVAGAASSGLVYEKVLHPKDADVNQYDWDAAVDSLTDNQTDGNLDVVPDILVEFTFPNFSLAIVKAFSQADHSLDFLHTHSMREQTVIISAENTLDGHEGTSYLPVDGESGDMFDDHFRGVLGISRQSQWDSHVYDAGFLFAMATVMATKDMDDPGAVTGADIRDAMFELNDPDGEVIRPGADGFAEAAAAIAAGDPINYEGASGPCDFDAHGRALNRIAHWHVESQEVSDLAVYDCVADAACPKR